MLNDNVFVNGMGTGLDSSTFKPGSLSVPTGQWVLGVSHVVLTGSQRLVLSGTSTLRIV